MGVRTVPAPLPQLLSLWAPFQNDPLTFCCHMMPIRSFNDGFSCADVTFGLGVLHLLQPLPGLVVPTNHVCLEITDIYLIQMDDAKQRC